MGRRKTYQRDDLIERAMLLFWRTGYEGTSIAALTDHLGVNKFGLYAEFGSKQGLYESALQRYAETVVSRHFGRLETEVAGLDDIVAVFNFFATEPEPEPIRLGCMMCNAATERASLDLMSATQVASFVKRLTAAHHNALSNAERDGQLLPETDIPTQSALLVSQLIGLFVLRRALSNPAAWHLAGAQSLRHVEALRQNPPGAKTG